MEASGPPERRDPYERGDLRPSSIGEVVRALLADRRLGRGVALGRLAASWAEVVGESLARVTSPRALEDGVLVVGAETAAWAAQLSFLAEEIGRKANETLGREAVASVRVVVAPPSRKALRRNG